MLLVGCGTVYVNEADRNPTYLKETAFVSELSSEMTYRRIYTMLYTCTSGYYRVKGDYDPKTRNAVINLDTGVGFQNDLFFADSHVMRVTIDPDGTTRSKVRIDQTSRDGSPFADAMERWVKEESDEC